MVKRFEAAPVPPDWVVSKSRFNIAPTQDVVIVRDDGKRHLLQMRWGLIPSWAKDLSFASQMINARVETVAVKPAFKEALAKRRCLVVADGFYEWQKIGGQKQPVRIVLKTHEPFGFAGLWDCWRSPEGEEIFSCAIITTEANDLLKPVHERMPVILPQESESLWLDPSARETKKLLPLLKPYPSHLMELYPVSQTVNSPKNDLETCIIPIKKI